MQPVTAGLLELLVFSKPYFDPDGLIVAECEGSPVGFVHAGFGSNDDGSTLSTEMGTVFVLMLRGDHRHAALADALLERAEAYERDRGAKVLYAGGIRPLNAFYLGLYGGSELPGVLTSDPVLGETCLRNNYREIERVAVLQRELSRFRAPISRAQRQLRREAACRELVSPPARSWWEACTMGAFERSRYTLEPSAGGDIMAEASFWDIEPLSTCWGVPTAGMVDLHVPSRLRRQGVASYLLGEAFARLSGRGIVAVEAQTMQTNVPALALYQKLGFARVDEGVVYRKG
jgi:GNAT superfamily N-acetyltransferase